MRLFVDFEFTGARQDTTPISIGVVSDCGSCFYGEFTDFNRFQQTDWLTRNVLAKLTLVSGIEKESELLSDYKVSGDKDTIAAHLRIWLEQFSSYECVYVWGYNVAFDWVLFCELLGGMNKLPIFIYKLPFDVATLLLMHGYDAGRDFLKLSTTDTQSEHNALNDAIATKNVYQKIYQEKPK